MIAPGAVAPRRALLEVTSRCNLRCRMCHYQARGVDIDPAWVERLAGELVEVGVGVVFVTGGEPFLHPELRRIIAALLEAGLDVRLSTNGVLITRKTIVAMAGVRDVSISLDGPAERHDAIRGRHGSHARAIRGIRLIQELLPECRICLSFTLMPDNCDWLAELPHVARELGVAAVGVQPVTPGFGRGARSLDPRRHPESGARMAEALEAHTRRVPEMGDNRPEFVRLCLETLRGESHEPSPCKAGQEIFTLFAHGGLAPCWGVASGVDAVAGLGRALLDPRHLRAVERARQGDCPGCLFDCYR